MRCVSACSRAVSATGAGLFEHAISLAKDADSDQYKECGDQIEVRSGRTVCRRRKWRAHNRDTGVHHREMPGSVRRAAGGAQSEGAQRSARGGQRSQRKDPVFGARWSALSAKGSSLRRDVGSAQREGVQPSESSGQYAGTHLPDSRITRVLFARLEFVDWTRLISARYTP